MTTRALALTAAALLGSALAGGCGDDGTGPPTPTTITVAPGAPKIASLGETVRLAATVRDQRGRAMPDVAVTWSSGDTLVATVDREGLVTAAAEGAATVTATAGSASGSSTVTVEQVADSVALSPAADEIALGDTMRLAAEAFDANGHLVADSEFSWSSAHVAVATVDASGLVTAVGAGAATITAAVGDARGSARITVANPDRPTLVALYHAMDGPGWVDAGKWLTDAPLGEWYGVDTDASGRVIGLDLAGSWDEEAAERTPHGLSGPVPPELGDLAELEELRLASNHLSGPLPPELGRLAGLRVLSLGRNDLSGPLPPELGDLASLEELALAGNHLSGPLPTRIGDLAELRTLDLADNSLSGPVPPELGGLAGLRALALGGNRLSGPIPSGLGGLANLRSLGLDRNALSGAVPAELGDLGSLAGLRLDRNRLSGPIPAGLGDLAGLAELRLDGNRLSGPIPRTFTGLRLRLFGWDSGPGGACAPGTAEFVAWLDGVELWRGPFCNATDWATLADLFDATGGGGWARPEGWLGGPALEEWHGVRADSLGRVTALHLSGNRLAGALPGHLVRLARLTGLRVDGNRLGGRLPLSLAGLDLEEFHYGDTELCEPTDEDFRAWLEGIASRRGTGTDCAAPSDRDALAALHRDAGGGGWHDDENWLGDEPLGRWHGVEVDERGRVVALELESNALTGVIPPELGRLGELERLDLGWNELSQVPPEVVDRANRLTGPLPPELGDLTKLEWLDLDGNDLTGPLPPELGDLRDLVRLSLDGNDLTGPLPPELGDLGDLEWLDLGRNRLTGPIPRELGGLETLERLDLGWNRLTGPIPRELGDLEELEWLELGWNGLEGAIPSELARPADLESLILSGNGLSGALPAGFGEMARLGRIELTGNAGLAGALPDGLTGLRLESLLAGDTDLCAPADSAFQAWLRTIPRRRIARCDGGAMAYLVQAVQSRAHPVPLVADEEALLRVFVTARKATSEGIPRVVARFHVDGAERHVADIPAKSAPIPTKVEEGELRKSANAKIPSGIVVPGLEMVIEIDPDGDLDPDLGVPGRIPAEGRMAVDVRRMPVLDLTVVPFLWDEDPDSAVLDAADGMEDDPEGHDLLEATRVLLPVGGLDVTAHDPVVSTSNSAFDLLAQTEALRVLEGGGGHYMGVMSGPVTGAEGVAYTPGRSNFSVPDSEVIAHELGHNMGLWHAPCGDPDWLDPSYPDPRGRIGAWGYDFRSGRLVLPRRPDLMSYCEPLWVGDYHFASALGHRLSDEGGSGEPAPPVPARSLLLWGGTDAEGKPFLNPAFVAHAPAALPDSAGDHALTGRDAAGGELFALSFTMPVALAEDDGGSSFAFALPVRSEWAGELAEIVLSGPGDASATLDADTDRPMAIVVDRRTGRVRAFLRDATTPPAVEAGLEVLFSRGIPGAGQWRR